ncbi:MAG: hypothetical protein D3M94_16835 [Rhodocyclales bacterium GT-UBC]|nr:MAG: hypothetical protein D3M94_16835 [Rhodocyclales bacterium GT-UBC]
MASLSFAASGLAGGLWAQLQQQQAERLASQADQKAKALRAQAGEAQAVAERAKENARSLKVQSDQAQQDASSAQLNLETAKSVGKVQESLSQRHLAPTASSSVASDGKAGAAVSGVAASVVNAQGQTTGTLVNVTA